MLLKESNRVAHAKNLIRPLLKAMPFIWEDDEFSRDTLLVQGLVKLQSLPDWNARIGGALEEHQRSFDLIHVRGWG